MKLRTGFAFIFALLAAGIVAAVDLELGVEASSSVPFFFWTGQSNVVGGEETDIQSFEDGVLDSLIRTAPWGPYGATVFFGMRWESFSVRTGATVGNQIPETTFDNRDNRGLEYQAQYGSLGHWAGFAAFLEFSPVYRGWLERVTTPVGVRVVRDFNGATSERLYGNRIVGIDGVQTLANRNALLSAAIVDPAPAYGASVGVWYEAGAPESQLVLRFGGRVEGHYFSLPTGEFAADVVIESVASPSGVPAGSVLTESLWLWAPSFGVSLAYRL